MSEPITDQELEELEALCERATPGTWYADNKHCIQYAIVRTTYYARIGGGDKVAARTRQVDANFIAASRGALPRLIVEVRRLRGNLKFFLEYPDAEFERLLTKNAQLREENERLWKALSATTDPICVCGKPFSHHILHDDGVRRCYILDKDGASLVHSCDNFERMEVLK